MIGETTLIAIDALDKLSRFRALTDVESYSLERLIRAQEASNTGRARLQAWMLHGLIMAMHIPDVDQAIAVVGKKKVVAVLREAA